MFIAISIISIVVTVIIIRCMPEVSKDERALLVEGFKTQISNCKRLSELEDLKKSIGLTMGDLVYDVDGGICEDMDDVWRDLSNAIEAKRKEIQNS